jgi:hypothetical protein
MFNIFVKSYRRHLVKSKLIIADGKSFDASNDLEGGDGDTFKANELIVGVLHDELNCHSLITDNRSDDEFVK